MRRFFRDCHVLRLAFLLSSLLLAGPALSQASDQGDLEFGHIHLPPFGYTDSEGESTGYLVELARRVFDSMDQPVRFVQHPATRLYRQIDTGETAFTLASAELHRLSQTAIEAEEAAITLTLTLYRRKGTPAINDVEQLRGQHLVLLNGYSYGKLGEFFEAESDAIRISKARTHRSALRMIHYGRADYLLDYQTPADLTIAQNSMTGLERDVIGRVPVHFFVSKALDNAQALADAWDHNLRKLKASDRLPSRDHYDMGVPNDAAPGSR